MYNCKECNTPCETLDKLHRHLMSGHKISSQQIYNEYILNNKIPTCKCGCGEHPNFISFTRGYKEWIRGHISRVKNNWGHNQTAINNSSKKRREQYATGERSVWNKGLNKKNNISLEIAGQKISDSFSDSKKVKYSLMMKKMRLDGTVPTRYGKESANWKGGTSSINTLVRTNSRLYTEWIYPILIRDKFACLNCGSIKKLEVHHDNEQMSEILHKFVDRTREFEFDEKREIVEKIINYHVKNKVSGKTLCNECHKRLHPSYNIV